MSSHACLDLLPTELKTRIAEECYRWDSTRTEPRQLFSDKDSNARKYPSAVGALLQVSREWNAIAASFRFRSLSPKQCADPTFQLILRPKYGHHLKALDLLNVPSDAVPGLFTFLASFTGTLDHLTIPNVHSLTAELARQLPESIDRTFQTETFVRDILRRLIRSSETVSVASHVFGSLNICIGSTVRCLSLAGELDERQDLPFLLDVNASCSTLVKLDFRQAGAYIACEAPTTFVSALPSPEAMPPVRTLHLDTFVRSASLRSLVGLFASTLVHLELTIGGPVRTVDLNTSIPNLARQYPRLATLGIGNRVDAAVLFLPPPSPAAFPSLRRLVWDLPQSSLGPVKPALANQMQRLVTFFAKSVPPLQVDVFATCIGLVSVLEAIPHSVPPSVMVTVSVVPNKVEASKHPTRFICRPRLIEDPDEPLEDAQEAIYDSLRAIQHTTDFAVATGDRTQLAKIGEALQECEWMRHNLRSG